MYDLGEVIVKNVRARFADMPKGSRQKCAAEAGVSYEVISSVLNRNRRVRADHIQMFADFFEVDPRELLVR